MDRKPTKAEQQANDYAAECNSARVETLARTLGESDWTAYGSVGWIKAAELHAKFFADLYSFNLEGYYIEVKDAHDSSRPMATFKMKRTVSYHVVNPRQGCD